MAKLEAHPKLDLEIVFKINEAEARALDALVGYNFETFIKVFEEQLGSHYIKNHKQGLENFFKDIHRMIPGFLDKIDNARKEFNK